MQAVMLRRHGGPEVLSLEEIAMPRPKAGEVLVKTHTIGVGKPDVLFRTGVYRWLPPLPLVIGNEMAGHVVEVGDGVEDLRRGQPVHVLNITGGCYAQYLAAPAESVIALPEGCNVERAVGALNFLLAYCMLHEVGHVREGQQLYLNGAAGGVGTAIIQLAKLAGMRVIAGASSPAKCAFAKSHGADEVIDYSASDPVQAVLDLTHGRGVNLVLDHIVGPTFGRSFDMLATLGQVVTYNRLAGLPEKNVMQDMVVHLTKSLGLRSFSLHCYDDDIAQRTRLMKRVLGLLVNGFVRVPVADRLPLASAQQAHARLDAGEVLGKLLLKP